jgi:hypothetical protein
MTDTCSKRVKSTEGFVRCPNEAYARSIADGHVSYRCRSHYDAHLVSEWAELVYLEIL